MKTYCYYCNLYGPDPVARPGPLHIRPGPARPVTYFLYPRPARADLCSTCPNHLNLPCLTTFATLQTPKRLYKSSLRFLSFRDTPHIYLIIMCSALSRLCKFSAFIAHVPVPYVNRLWTQALKISPFMRCDGEDIVV